MKQNKLLWLLTLLLLAAVGGGVLATGFSMIRLAHARQTETSPKVIWEYCSITLVDSSWDSFRRQHGRVEIRYFDMAGSSGEVVEAIVDEKASSNFTASREAVAKATAKLGKDGWEMVAITVTGEKTDYVTYLFKRLKP